MMRKSVVLAIILVIAITALSVVPALAQDGAKVFAVLFYSPTCPHCHEVITYTVPELEAEFGDSMEILYIDVTTPTGQQMIFDACNVVGIPADVCGGVPMMVIGDDVLIGSADIPAKAAKLIRAGLKKGGLPIPAIPGLQEAYDEYQRTLAVQGDGNDVADPDANASADQGAGSAEDSAVTASEDEVKSISDMTVAERIARDPAGNAIAIVVLAALIACVGIVMISGLNSEGSPAMQSTAWVAALVSSLAGFVMGLTLVAAPGTGLTSLLSMLVTISMMVAALTLIGAKQKGRRGARTYHYPNWLLLVVVIGGMMVAGYLAYVEASESAAVCGMVGDCNTVQQSEFARLFGVLPIGLFGLIGYALILAAWLVTQINDGQLGTWAQVGLLGFALFGVLFSIYLTFLEPFVIGATCAWCITSAIVMVLILWLVAADGWQALHQLRGMQKQEA